VLDALFDGLNAKLEPIGLNIAHARVGFDPKVDPRTILAKLKTVKLV
jgi:hypothetical protein